MKIYYTWKQIVEETKILADAIKKEPKLDTVIAIATGGWIPARLMKNFLPADYFSLGCKSYSDDTRALDTLTITQHIHPECVEGKNVLLLDDVCDSGQTLETTRAIIQKMNPIGVHSAVLHLKQKSTVIPEFFVKKFSDEWIVYPWELD